VGKRDLDFRNFYLPLIPKIHYQLPLEAFLNKSLLLELHQVQTMRLKLIEKKSIVTR
jgi:hypothetical protein